MIYTIPNCTGKARSTRPRRRRARCNPPSSNRYGQEFRRRRGMQGCRSPWTNAGNASHGACSRTTKVRKNRPKAMSSPRETPKKPLLERCKIIGAYYGLSKREIDVFHLLSLGRSAARIQEELLISAGTVNTHTYHIYTKLDVHSQQQLIDLMQAADLDGQEAYETRPLAARFRRAPEVPHAASRSGEKPSSLEQMCHVQRQTHEVAFDRHRLWMQDVANSTRACRTSLNLSTTWRRSASWTSPQQGKRASDQLSRRNLP